MSTLNSSIRHYITDHCPVPAPLRKIAQLGFWFFLIKGLLWLAVPSLLYWYGY